MSTIQGLDNAILLLVDEKSIVKEIAEAGEFKEMIQMYLVKINRQLNKLQLSYASWLRLTVDSGHSQPSIGDSSLTKVTQV